MSSYAIEVREVSGLLQQDSELMKRWKAASQTGKIQAVSSEGRHLAVISDPQVIEHLRTHHPEVRLLSYDGDAGSN